MITKVIMLAMAAAVLGVILRQQKGEFAMMISIAVGAVIFYMLKDEAFAAVSAVTAAVERMGIKTEHMSVLFKVIGIAYLTQFGASVCADAGEKAIAMKIELAGRLSIILMTIPVMLAVIDLITGILP